MNAPLNSPIFQRSLSAVFTFYDAFLYPPGSSQPPDPTPLVGSPLGVSIPSLQWQAAAADDGSYRFSALTLTQPAPGGANLAVQVDAPLGDYLSFDPITITLPLPISSPPLRSDFLIPTKLWPTVAFRPPSGETAVRGIIASPTAQPVSNLKIEMWLGAGPAPGSPYTFTNLNGEFLFRFPLFQSASGQTTQANIQINSGAIPVLPAAPTVLIGATQILQFQRT